MLKDIPRVATDSFLEELKYELSTLLGPIEIEGEEKTSLGTFIARQQSLWIEETFRLKQAKKPDSGKPKTDMDMNNNDILIRPYMTDHNIPLLQGPYLLQPAPKETCDGDVFACDIAHVSSESFAVISILYSNSKMDVFVEFEPVSPRWISKTVC